MKKVSVAVYLPLLITGFFFGCDNKGQRQLEYWNAVSSIAQEMESQDYRNTATKIRAVPISEVDPDIVNHVVEGSQLFIDKADMINRVEGRKLGNTLAEGLTEGVMNSLLKMKLQLEQMKQTQQSADEILAFWKKVEDFEAQELKFRAELLSRYKVDFPPLELFNRADKSEDSNVSDK